MTTKPIIIGAGLAGLTVALSLAPRPCIVLGRKVAAGWTSSELAQGGIAAAVGEGDAPAFHERDTMAAGAGSCDSAVVRMITQAAPSVIERLQEWGVAFDRDVAGDLDTGLEGAHSHRRIVHAQGDSTGAAIMRALVERVRATPSITLIEDVEVTGILTNQPSSVTPAQAGVPFGFNRKRDPRFHGDDELCVCKTIAGVTYHQRGSRDNQQLLTDSVVLATGSACALWKNATVPLGSWGHGLLLAADAGAALRDLEFVQFHPTGLDAGCDPMPLISEAVRGEGAFLVNDRGERFVEELAPRDVVALSIASQIESGRRVFLDARHLTDFAAHFPTVFGICRKAGLDPARHLIPVRPVAHYHMGGIATDAQGQTNVQGLWACGECAATGLHGANRLASNSLLEATAMGQRVAESISHSVIPPKGDRVAERTDKGRDTPDTIAQVREIMTRHVGVMRDAVGLQKAIDELSRLAEQSPRARVGLMIARAALAREGSLGAHCRTDERRKKHG
ncbi:MAG: FAD-binding protein [Bdellovibrionales bacterium]